MKDLISGLGKSLSKPNINKIASFIAITIILFLVNYWAASNLLGGQEFFINWSAGRLVFFDGKNPYLTQTINYIEQTAKAINVLPELGGVHYSYPLYSLFLYFPFALIQNFIIARTLWLMFNEVLLFFSAHLIMQLIGWPSEKKYVNFFLLFTFSFFYSLIALLQGSDCIFLLFILLVVLLWIDNRKFIGVGVLLSFLTIKPHLLVVPIIVIFYFLLIKKGGSAILWFFISLLILLAASYFFVPDWPIGYLREIFLNGSVSGMTLPGISIGQWLDHPHIGFWNILGIFCVGLIIGELTLSKFDDRLFIWLICLVITLNLIILIQNNLSVMCFLLLPFGLIFQQWLKRNNIYGSRFIYISFLFFSVFFLIIGIFTQSFNYAKPAPFVFYFLPVLFILINLYWIRGWLRNDQIGY